MELSDDEIIRRVQGGDREEYVALFDRHYARIERFARLQLHDAELARDIASETFLRAYRSVDRFRRGEQITYLGYLFLICRRLILTEQSRRAAGGTRSLDEKPEEARQLPDRAESPVNQLLDAERRAVLRQALRRLPADDREIVQLAFEQGLSRREIGTIMGKPSVSAVTSHLHRAMQRLRSLVVEGGYFRTESDSGRK